MSSFSVEEGEKIALGQVDFYANQVAYNKGLVNSHLSYDEALNMVKKSVAEQDGYEVARGVAIESLAWKYSGKTAEEYSQFLASCD